uniref:Hydroxysteroid dehydrogenase-like protein 2 n=1 Tax=Gouania willdenowi TaxID=441366 RepID=A0A8C5DZ92_GOUWI
MVISCRKLAGIGKAIALKAARDGANVVIAAKNHRTTPKLPGTIYTAAQEVEAAGGKALPCVVDIRDEQQIGEAVKKAVDTFGGIDILVNNASAISLTGTLETPMKRVDLMLGINLRGTYLTYLKAGHPHLLKSRCPHILNLSPPLNLNPVWFRTTRVNHGHPLLPDFFLDAEPETLAPPPSSAGPIENTFDLIKGVINDEVVKATKGIYQFNRQHSGVWFMDLKNGAGSVGRGEPNVKADVVMTMDSDDFTKMFAGKMKPTMAFMSGKLRIKGDMTLAIKLEKLMGRMNSKL